MSIGAGVHRRKKKPVDRRLTHRTAAEVARLLRITPSSVLACESRALDRIARAIVADPVLREAAGLPERRQ